MGVWLNISGKILSLYILFAKYFGFVFKVCEIKSIRLTCNSECLEQSNYLFWIEIRHNSLHNLGENNQRKDKKGEKLL